MKGKIINASTYLETTRYSCGAASALMVLNFFKKTALTRENEFELMKEALALPFKIPSTIGLAILFAREGLNVKIISPIRKPTPADLRFPFNHDRIPKCQYRRKMEFEYYTFFRSLQLKIAKQLRINFLSRKPTIQDILESIESNNLVMVLTDDWWLRKFIWKRKLKHRIHWVVAIGFDDDFIYVIDPSHGRIKIPINAFPKLMDTGRYNKILPVVIKVSNKED